MTLFFYAQENAGLSEFLMINLIFPLYFEMLLNLFSYHIKITISHIEALPQLIIFKLYFIIHF